jgi:hypothetical protein
MIARLEFRMLNRHFASAGEGGSSVAAMSRFCLLPLPLGALFNYFQHFRQHRTGLFGVAHRTQQLDKGM